MWSALQCLASLREVKMSEVKENGEMIIPLFRRRYSESGKRLNEGIYPVAVAPAQVFRARYTSEETELCLLPVQPSAR